jgi:predicted kinase
MNNELFKELRRQAKKNYGLSKRNVNFVPFENWRFYLKNYPKKFDKEYLETVSYLKKKFKLDKLKEIDNPDKKLFLFSGMPGAGKTTLSKIIEKTVPNTILLRGHDIVDILGLYGKKVELYRKRLKEFGFEYPDPWYISYLYQDRLTRDCLNLGYNVIFDDHIRTRKNREEYLDLAKETGAEIIFVQINAPFETYLKREEGKVNDEKIKFLGRFVFQSEDISDAEKRKYDQVIFVDGTKEINEIEKSILSKLKF